MDYLCYTQVLYHHIIHELFVSRVKSAMGMVKCRVNRPTLIVDSNLEYSELPLCFFKLQNFLLVSFFALYIAAGDNILTADNWACILFS